MIIDSNTYYFSVSNKLFPTFYHDVPRLCLCCSYYPENFCTCAEAYLRDRMDTKGMLEELIKKIDASLNEEDTEQMDEHENSKDKFLKKYGHL